MEILRSLQDITPVPDGVVTVGTFDGIHRAHQAILKTTLACARENRTTATVVTFDPHPRLVVKQKNGRRVELLTTTEEKIALLEEFHPDRVIIIPFTAAFSRTSPEDFIATILCDTIGMRRLVIGYDHGFGRNRSGDTAFLKKCEKTCGFILDIQEPISNESGIISSTLIRKFLAQGRVDKAAACLGRPYHLKGTVVKGDSRGRANNYPTANIHVDNGNKCIPCNGVYAVRVRMRDEYHKGVMNIGVRPTYGDNPASLEVHIIDFDRDIYGAELEISFLQRVRHEKKFESTEQLIRQIHADVAYTRNYLSSTGGTRVSDKTT